ncbi:MAG: aminoacyl-tRNA hydrolase [Chloroflexi bacterium]|nr:aminoacyl-tRNA hydrolase [Chloroflexota bacterium]
MRLIVGLGNPGTRYRNSRHNVGFWCVDTIARDWEIPSSERRAKVVLGRGRHAGQDVVLAKPRTFMNNSGEGVEYLLTRFGARPEDLVVVYDEMALPLGTLRIRPSGSDAGHKGIRSIISTLHTQAVTRIRVGIGPPPPGHDPISYVLGHFSEEEYPVITETLNRVAAAVDCLLKENIDVAMNLFNRSE